MPTRQICLSGQHRVFEGTDYSSACLHVGHAASQPVVPGQHLPVRPVSVELLVQSLGCQARRRTGRLNQRQQAQIRLLQHDVQLTCQRAEEMPCRNDFNPSRGQSLATAHKEPSAHEGLLARLGLRAAGSFSCRCHKLSSWPQVLWAAPTLSVCTWNWPMLCRHTSRQPSSDASPSSAPCEQRSTRSGAAIWGYTLPRKAHHPSSLKTETGCLCRLSAQFDSQTLRQGCATCYIVFVWASAFRECNCIFDKDRAWKPGRRRFARLALAGTACCAASWRRVMARSKASSARNSDAAPPRGQPVGRPRMRSAVTAAGVDDIAVLQAKERRWATECTIIKRRCRSSAGCVASLPVQPGSRRNAPQDARQSGTRLQAAKLRILHSTFIVL